MQAQVENNQSVIRLTGRFDFKAHREFKSLCEGPLKSPSVRELQVDMGAVEHLDGSGLGMLLMLKERAQVLNKTVVLANARGAVRQALEIASFDKLFRIT